MAMRPSTGRCLATIVAAALALLPSMGWAAESRWACDRATGRWLFGGYYDVESAPGFDPSSMDVYTFPDADPHPDPILTRCDPVLKRRLATSTERTAAQGPKPKEFRRGLASVFGRSVDRMLAVIERYPAFGIVYAMLLQPEPMTLDQQALFARIAVAIKAKIGTPQEVLTAGEYAALQALAEDQGMGALVP